MKIQLKEIEAKTINVNWIEVICTTSEGVFVLQTDKVRLGQLTPEQWCARAVKGWIDGPFQIENKINN